MKKHFPMCWLAFRKLHVTSFVVVFWRPSRVALILIFKRLARILELQSNLMYTHNNVTPRATR